jgi:hypothetical protein
MPIVLALMMMVKVINECGDVDGMRIDKDTEVLEGNLPQLPPNSDCRGGKVTIRLSYDTA